MFDADVHGPSLPAQLPSVLKDGAQVTLAADGWAVLPLEHKSLKLMSMGWLCRLWSRPADEVRSGHPPGRLAAMLLHSTAWGELDYLIVDSPPGTGEIPRALYSKVPLTGAIVVTTPSSLAISDVVRGVGMLDRFNVPVLALVENMASFKCGNCDEIHYPFGTGRVSELLKDRSVPVPIFRLPIVANTANSGADLRSCFDDIAASLERSPAPATRAELYRDLEFYDRPHWPTISSMAEITSC